MPFLLAVFLALFTLTLAAPQVTATSPEQPTAASTSSPSATPTNCISDNFVSPWQISNVVIVSPPPGTNAFTTFISFAFYDPNEDLVLNTYCGGAVEHGDVQMANGGYVKCDNPYVQFQLQDDETILVARWYGDPCKGNPPYDSGMAFGQSDADFRVISGTSGTMKYQQLMQMNVTRMS